MNIIFELNLCVNMLKDNELFFISYSFSHFTGNGNKSLITLSLIKLKTNSTISFIILVQFVYWQRLTLVLSAWRWPMLSANISQ